MGAYIGGQVCARVAHDAGGATILIGLVIVLGVVNALIPPEMTAGPRPDDVSMIEATAGARQPAWFNWLDRLIGVVGVWFGSRKLRAVGIRPASVLRRRPAGHDRRQRTRAFPPILGAPGLFLRRPLIRILVAVGWRLGQEQEGRARRPAAPG